MHEAIVALQGIQAPGAAGPQAPGGPGTAAPDVAVEKPSDVQAAAFAQAVGQSGPTESWAARPVSGGSLTNRLAQQAESLANHLRAPGAAGAGLNGLGGEGEALPALGGPGAMPAGPHDLSQTLAANKVAISQSLDRMERAYMYAIEATMASRGSTEATKIFNTLLKGQ